MHEGKRGLALCLSVLLFLALASCQQGSADGDGDPASVSSTAVHPIEVTGVRWLADRTVADLEGGGATSCLCSNPNKIARPVPENPGGDCAVVCLGARGFLIAQMSATFTNRSGADLLVYEWGSQHGGTDDCFSVYVSSNGHQWITVAEAIRNDPDRPYASIDLGDARGQYLYVRIVPAPTNGLRLGEGPEILAIEALHPSVEFEF
jgi:hypothetical protein